MKSAHRKIDTGMSTYSAKSVIPAAPHIQPFQKGGPWGGSLSVVGFSGISIHKALLKCIRDLIAGGGNSSEEWVINYSYFGEIGENPTSQDCLLQ